MEDVFIDFAVIIFLAFASNIVCKLMGFPDTQTSRIIGLVCAFSGVLFWHLRRIYRKLVDIFRLMTGVK